MKERKKNIKIFAVLLCFLMLVSRFFMVEVYADSLVDTDANSTVSGWAYSTQPGHMGTKTSNYTFESSAVRTKYSSYVEDGIKLWGSNISMTYTSSSGATGTFKESKEASTATASTLVTSTTEHRTAYTITIYDANFNASGKAAAGKARTIAHEIGHAYGLGHVTSSSNIMYGQYSASKNVTSQDIWGMKVVTHVHTHTVSTTGTYSKCDTACHYVVCSSCSGKYKQIHDVSSKLDKCIKCGYTGPFSIYNSIIIDEEIQGESQ